MKKYKVAIDVSPLSDGNAVRGVGYYTRNLIAALQKEVKINPDYKNFQIDFIENRKLKIENYDLVHYPFFDPFKLTLPKTKTPFVVTVHDLIPREFSSHFPVGLKGEINWLIQKHRLRRAQYLLCPSHTARYAIGQILHYPLDRIFVTYEAADPSFRPINKQKLLDKIKNKYHLPPKFVLFVGDINWNKNIPTLVKACQNLQLPLVIVGKAATQHVPSHPWTRDIIWLQKQKIPTLTLTGFVPDEDLPLIFNLATIYCQPSFSEGFGLPLLQAMQSSTPTLYSQNTSLSEISDHNGLEFDPHEITDLQRKLSLLWDSPELQHELSQKGKIRATHFSWKSTALQSLAVYRLCQLDEKK